MLCAVADGFVSEVLGWGTGLREGELPEHPRGTVGLGRFRSVVLYDY